MLEYYEVLKKSPLFAGADENALSHILRCMEAHICIYGKGEIIYHYGEPVSRAGIVLEGKAALIAPGMDGDESHIRFAGPAEAFGCSNSCLLDQPALVMVLAKKRTKILFLKVSKLFRPEALGCAYAGLVTVNLLKQTAAENLAQNLRIHIMSQKSIRDKLKLMLSQISPDGKNALLSMNRQELADYLGVERSALSREMARMKKEGLIDYRKNEITILYQTA
nr:MULTISPECIES: Crp/Fnr family transcriptional regulator [unclassified Clostridium]